MNHDLCVRQGKTLALCTACQQECAHARSHAHADRRYIAFYIIHRIINRHACRDRSARAVDIELNILIRILRLQKQKLRNDQVRANICHFLAQKNDPVVQQSGKNIVGTFASSGLFDDIRYKTHFVSS